MNPTEIIATKLLGFWECATPDWWREELGHRWYRSLAAARCRVHADGYALPGSAYGVWPDLSDWNDIRRMEDALAEKGLLGKYCHQLCKDRWVLISDPITDVGELIKRATAEQCVAAALKVIEEAGL
jgi:hypothetical protein